MTVATTPSVQDGEYHVFTRDHDLEVTAKFLLENPDFEPYAKSSRYPNASVGANLATPAQLDETVKDVVIGGADMTGTAVTILVDISGSQRTTLPGAKNYGGQAAPHLIETTDRMVHALEAYGAKVEVLAFSTVRWKGGLSREDWRTARGPNWRENPVPAPPPGRLTDLLHIVVKEFDEPWDSKDPASPRIGLDHVCRDPYMRDGVDGEAVEWAVRRLDGRSEPNKVLIPLSDCSPADDSTMSVNPDGLLARHLLKAVAEAEASGVDVIAVDNGGRRRIPQIFYRNVAYSEDGRDMDPREAAKAAILAVARAVEMKPASSPRP